MQWAKNKWPGENHVISFAQEADESSVCVCDLTTIQTSLDCDMWDIGFETAPHTASFFAVFGTRLSTSRLNGSTAQRRSRWHDTLGSPYHRDGPGHRTRYTIQVATCNKVGIWASSSYGNSNVRDLLSSLLQNCNGSLTLKSNCDYLKSHCKIVFPKIWVNPPTTAYLLLKI